MIVVRVFGTWRERLGLACVRLDSHEIGRIGQVFEELARASGGRVSVDELRYSAVLVNGCQVPWHRVLRHPLEDGDEVALLSPAGGG